MADIDFEKIVLSKEEMKALKILKKHNLLWDDQSKESMNRLIRLELAERYQTRWENKPCYAVRISDPGRDYLMYANQSKHQKRRETCRYWVTTMIAAAALIKSFFPEICAGLAWLWSKLGL